MRFAPAMPARSLPSRRALGGLPAKRNAALAPLLLSTILWSCSSATPAPGPATAQPKEDLGDSPGFVPACSKGIAERLQGLRQPLTIRLYASKRTPDLALAGERLRKMLRWFERAGAGKVVLEVLEAKTREEILKANDRGLVPFDPAAGPGVEDDPAKHVVSGAAFEYGGEIEAIPRFEGMTWTTGLRGWIDAKIREIVDRAEGRKRTIGVIAGKGEIKLTDPNLIAASQGAKRPTMLEIISEALPFYPIEEVDLHGGDTEIRPDLRGLLITQPSKAFTDKELRRIDAFVMRGKSLAVFASAVNVPPGDGTLQATLRTWSIERLLDGYGIEMRREVVLDWGSTMSVPTRTADGKLQSIVLHGIVLAEAEWGGLVSSCLPFFQLEEVAFPFASPLDLHPEKQPDATMKVLARSSSKATVESAEPLDLHFTSDLRDSGAYASRALAVSIEGKIRSAFGGQGTTGATAGVSAANSRVLVMSSSQFLVNPLARSGNPVDPGAAAAALGNEDLQLLSQLYAQKYLTATILVFKNTLDWMTLEEDERVCFEEREERVTRR